MIFSRALRVTFVLDGGTHSCTVDKIYMQGHRPAHFFRIGAVSGNRDLICHDGEWMVCNGPPLRNELVDAIGEAIEKALENEI